MDIGSGIGILGAWVFAAMVWNSKYTTPIAMYIAAVLALSVTAYLK